MSKLRQALNYLEILKEAIKLPINNRTLILRITLFILFPCNLILSAINKLGMPISYNIKRDDKIIFEFELVRDIFQWLATTLAIYLLSKAYIENPCSVLQSLSTLRKQWKKIFITSFLTEIIIFNSSFLLMHINGYPLNKTIFRFVIAMIGFCGFVFVYLICQLSIVITSVEESSHGLCAMRKGVEIIKGRRVESFVVMALMFIIDALVNCAAVGIVFQLVWCSVYSVLYLESRKRQRTEDDEKWIV